MLDPVEIQYVGAKVQLLKALIEKLDLLAVADNYEQMWELLEKVTLSL